uniref:Uncharacterized protein n=1 Tax=Cacopsylla melanoneura TaxID=428564 RepID=A0A8D8PYI3_9HEMI
MQLYESYRRVDEGRGLQCDSTFRVLLTQARGFESRPRQTSLKRLKFVLEIVSLLFSITFFASRDDKTFNLQLFPPSNLLRIIYDLLNWILGIFDFLKIFFLCPSSFFSFSFFKKSQILHFF